MLGKFDQNICDVISYQFLSRWVVTGDGQNCLSVMNDVYCIKLDVNIELAGNTWGVQWFQYLLTNYTTALVFVSAPTRCSVALCCC